MSELQQLIRVAADEAGGYRTLAARSRGAVSHSTLNNLATGRHSGRLKPVQLSGVAAAIGRPAPEVARLLGLQYANPGRPFVMPERANALTPQQRKIVMSVVEGLLSAYEQGREEAANGTVTSIGSYARKTRTNAKQDVDVVPAPQRAARTVKRPQGKTLREDLDRQAETPPPLPEDEP